MTLLRGFLSVSALTLASRLLGMTRDIVIAATFGAGGATDAFFAAFRLPNMLRRFTAEGALTQAFVPLYAQERRADPARAAALAGEILAHLAAVLTAVTLLCCLFAPAVIALLAPGLSRPHLAATLLAIVFPYIVLISLAALLAGMLNAAQRFAAAAAAPLLLNIALIAAALAPPPPLAAPITALAWGVLAGGILQLAWLTWHATRAGLTPARPPLAAPSPQARRIFRLFWRSALGAGAAQINLLINLAIASLLTAGSVSWLYYADRLMELPAGLLGAALTTVALPALATATQTRYNHLIDNTLRLAVFLSAPAAAGLAALSLPIIATLFMHGAFTAVDAHQTHLAVLAYAAGVPGLVMVRPLAAAFFARQNATVPVRSALAALAVTQLANLIFVYHLQLAHAGLAFSISLGATANAAILYIVLTRRGEYHPRPHWRRLLLQTALATAAMLAVLAAATPPPTYWLHAAAAAKLATLAALLTAAAAAYFATAALLGATKTVAPPPPGP